MSIPRPTTRKPSPQEVAATWHTLFTPIRDELIAKGVEDARATEIAAYVAATLVKESRHGNQPRNN